MASPLPHGTSFLFSFQFIVPNFDNQPLKTTNQGHWMPPDRWNAYNPPAVNTNPVDIYRWSDGVVNRVNIPANIPLHSHPTCDRLYRCATVFTQVPDSNHLLAVPFDARRADVALTTPHRWLELGFDHEKHPSGAPWVYSHLTVSAQHRTLAVRDNSHWARNLFSAEHQPTHNNPGVSSAGLTGNLSYILAAIVFSCPMNEVPNVLLSSVRLRRWIGHNRQTGRTAHHRGVVVTVWLDPSSNTTRDTLGKLEAGVFGAFFKP